MTALRAGPGGGADRRRRAPRSPTASPTSTVLRVGRLGVFKEKDARSCGPATLRRGGHAQGLPRRPRHPRGGRRPQPAPRCACAAKRRCDATTRSSIRPVPWQPHPLRLATRTPAPAARSPGSPCARGRRPSSWPRRFLLAARAVEVQVEPAPDRLVVRGGLQVCPGRAATAPPRAPHRARGEGRLRHPLERRFEVTRDPRQVARFALERLPGLLALDVTPAERRARQRGRDGAGASTPVTPLELPEGEHEVLLRPRASRPSPQRVQIAGGRRDTAPAGHAQARIARPCRSPPSRRAPGARGRRSVGATPLTVDLSSGDAPRRGRPRRATAAVAPHRGRWWTSRCAFPCSAWSPCPAAVAVTQRAAGGGGQRRRAVPRRDAARARRAGRTCPRRPPDQGRARPGRSDGHPGPGRDAAARASRLAAQQGEVQIASEPPDAEVLVDGQPRGKAGQTLTPHRGAPRDRAAPRRLSSPTASR